jgi:hypothetical protein
MGGGAGGGVGGIDEAGESVNRRSARRAVVLVAIAVGLVILIRFDVNREGWRSWLKPQPVLSVVTLVVGFIVLGWQLRRQHENTLAANRRQSQDRLKLDLFTELAKRIEATRVPITHSGMTPTAVVGELSIRLQISGRSSHTPASLGALAVDADASVFALMAMLETHEIVMPEFLVFRTKLAEAARALRVALGDFASLALPFVAVGKDGTALRWPPNDAEMNELSRFAGIAQRAGFDVGAVIHDLRVEAQNYLLGDLFGRQLPERKPTDPSFEVTSIVR